MDGGDPSGSCGAAQSRSWWVVFALILTLTVPCDGLRLDAPSMPHRNAELNALDPGESFRESFRESSVASFNG